MPYITDEEYQQFQELKFIQEEILSVQNAWKETAKHAGNADEAHLRGQGRSYIMNCDFLGFNRGWFHKFPLVYDSQINVIKCFGLYDMQMMPRALWKSIEKELSKNFEGDILDYLSSLDGWEDIEREDWHEYAPGDLTNVAHGFQFEIHDNFMASTSVEYNTKDNQ